MNEFFYVLGASPTLGGRSCLHGVHGGSGRLGDLPEEPQLVTGRAGSEAKSV